MATLLLCNAYRLYSPLLPWTSAGPDCSSRDPLNLAAFAPILRRATPHHPHRFMNRLVQTGNRSTTALDLRSTPSFTIVGRTLLVRGATKHYQRILISFRPSFESCCSGRRCSLCCTLFAAWRRRIIADRMSPSTTYCTLSGYGRGEG